MQRMKTARQRQNRLESTREDKWAVMWTGMLSQNQSLIPKVCLRLLFCTHLSGADDVGEEIVEPEVDLSTFLERQRLADVHASSLLAPSDARDDEEVDHSLAHISSRPGASTQLPRKGQVQSINWDNELEQMSRERTAAEAARGTSSTHYMSLRIDDRLDLKSRFRAKQSNSNSKQEQRYRSFAFFPSSNGIGDVAVCAGKNMVKVSPLPDESVSTITATKDEMQNFLDDLLG
jgi:hypothetical protein